MNPANTSQDALGQLQGAQAGAKSAADILAGANQRYGVQQAGDTVSGLRGAITNTTKLLNQVAPSVMGRTASSLVTSAQANRQIQNEQQPLAQQLSQQGQDYNTANEDFSRANQQANQTAQMEYGDQQNKISYLQNLYNTLFGREQAAEQARQAEVARQESIRQFNEQLALSKQAEARQAKAASAKSSGGLDISGLLGQMKPQYIGNNDYRGKLAYEAKRGDSDASFLLKYVGNDGKAGGKVANRSDYDRLKSLGVGGNYYA